MAFVLAGGRGNRMLPLTSVRAKPAIPFGANYRAIDFALTNVYHSGIRKICILTQYESESLHRHIRNGWYPRFGIGVNEFITTLPAKQGNVGGWYQGTADSIKQNIRYIISEEPNIVDILGGDHIYLMDINAKNEFHLDRKADITISGIPVKRELAANNYGVLVVDEDMKLLGFEEKPANPTPMPGNDEYCLASMGNYAFDPQVLVNELLEDSEKELSRDKDKITSDPDKYSSHDFGYDVIPCALRKGLSIYVYNFENQSVPGAANIEKGYWRDIGNIDQFYAANMDLIGENPSLNLYNNRWKILTYVESPQPAKLISTGYNKSCASNALIANGVIVLDANIDYAVIHYGCRVDRGSLIEHSILLGRIHVGENVSIKNAIIDKYTLIPDGTRIGYDRQEDLDRGFTISPEGITVVPRNYQFKK